MKAKLSQAQQQWQREQSATAFPRFIEDGVEVTDESVWAWVQIPDGSTQLLEDDELANETVSTAQALRSLLPVGMEYHIKIVWAPMSSERYRAQWDILETVRAPGLSDYIDLGCHRIDENARVGYFRRRIVLLGLRWSSATADSAATATTKAAARQLRSETLSYRQAQQRANAVRADVAGWISRMGTSPLRAQPAPAGLIAWAYAREMRRGQALQVPEGSEFSGARLTGLMAGEVHPPGGAEPYVTCIDAHTGQRRYVSVLVPAVNGFPVEELEIPGGEWLEALCELDGVEASVRGVNVGRQGTLDKISAAERVVGSQLREAGEQGATPPPEMQTAQDTLAERRQEITRRVDVETTNHCRWIVTAESPQALAEQVKTVQQHYAGIVDLHVPPYVQDLLWQEILPGDRVRVPEFGQDQPLRTLVGSWFHGGSRIGDSIGPYLGENLGSTPGPVQMHFTSRAAEHVGQPLTVTFTGKSGEAKSTSAVLCLLSVLANGAWGLLVDTKGDLVGVCEVAEQVLGIPVQRVDIMSPDAAGMMDPLRFAAGTEDARGLMLDALLAALSSEDRRRGETVLERAVDAVLARPRQEWSATAVLDALEADPSSEIARELGETLRRRAKLAQLRPVLGQLTAGGQALLHGRGLIYLGLSGLDFPRHTPDPDQWSVAQRASMATFRTSLAYALHQSRHQPEIPKWVCLTELHLLTAYPEGKAFVEWLARAGRALKLGLFLDSQSATDLAGIPGLVEQILCSFAFRADGRAEQDAQAALLHRPEPGPQLRAAQAGLGTGQCVVRDRDNQLGVMAFDRLTRWIAETLSTDAGLDTGDYTTNPDEPSSGQPAQRTEISS